MSAVWLLSAAMRLVLAACLAVPAWATRDCCCTKRAAAGAGQSCCQSADAQSKPLPPCCAKRQAAQRKASGPQVVSYHRCCCAKHLVAATPSVSTRAGATGAPATDAERLATAPVLWLELTRNGEAGRFRPGVPRESASPPWGAALCVTCCRWNV